jgi:hypothetical protein
MNRELNVQNHVCEYDLVDHNLWIIMLDIPIHNGTVNGVRSPVIHKFNNFIAAPMPLVMWALACGRQSDAMEGVSFASVERGKPQTKSAGQRNNCCAK